MTETIIISAAWYAFGFLCGFFLMGALAMAATISREEEQGPTPKN